MASALEIRQYLARMLSGHISLDEFEDWFLPYSWNIHKHGDRDAQELAYAIEHRLSEWSDDLLTEEQLRDELASMLPFALNATPLPVVITTGTSSTTLFQPALQVSIVHRQPEEASV
jgi:hypothetical protein